MKTLAIVALTAALLISQRCLAEAKAQCETGVLESSELAKQWSQGRRHTYDDAANGFSISYSGRFGFGTVYVFDDGQSGWIEGLTDPRLPRKLEEVAVAMKELERLGRFTNLSFVEQSSVRLFCQDFFRLVVNGVLDGRTVQSVTLVSVRDRKILKFRATFYSEPSEGLDSELLGLVAAALASGTPQ
jgi:hypothetical protein